MTITTITQSELTGIKPTEFTKRVFLIAKVNRKYMVTMGDIDTEDMDKIIQCDTWNEVISIISDNEGYLDA